MTDEPATSLRAALDAALTTTPVLPRDAAILALARQYADLIDDATARLSDAAEDDEARDFARMVATIARLGPRYEATLDRLGMSPGARSATRNGDPQGVNGGPDPGSVALDRLTGGSAAGPAAGIDYTAFVDSAVKAAHTGD